MRDINFGLGLNYDKGVQTSVAINSNGEVIEVHKAQKWNKLYWHKGHLNGMDVSWKKGELYDDGIDPSVAMNDNGLVVTVHRAQNKKKLYCAVGHFNAPKLANAMFYREGEYPSVALNNNNHCIEVHKKVKKGKSSDNIILKFGIVNSEETEVKWYKEKDFTGGVQPKVAVNNNGVVITVHRSANDLYYCIGKLQELNIPLNKSKADIERIGIDDIIEWGEFHKYDTGHYPNVALLDDGSVIEIHQQELELSQRIGTVNLESKQIEWSDSENYSPGNNPSLVAATDGSMAIQTHEGKGSDLMFSTSLITDRKRWMELMYEDIKYKKLWQIALPGTHDSGAFNMNTYRTGYGDAWRGLSGKLVKRYATTQHETIFEQLENGCRYLDLRVYYHTDENFYAIHDVMGANLIDVLDDVKRFMEETNNEFIILDLGSFFSFKTTEIHKKFVNLIRSKIGTYLFEDDMPTNLLKANFKDLVCKGSRVLINYNFDYILENPTSGFIREIDFTGKYSNTDSSVTMAADQVIHLLDKPGSPENLFYLFFTVVITGVGTFLKASTLYKLSLPVSRSLGKFLVTKTNGKQINLIKVDFYKDTRVTDCTIMMNRKKSIAANSSELD